MSRSSSEDISEEIPNQPAVVAPQGDGAAGDDDAEFERLLQAAMIESLRQHEEEEEARRAAASEQADAPPAAAAAAGHIPPPPPMPPPPIEVRIRRNSVGGTLAAAAAAAAGQPPPPPPMPPRGWRPAARPGRMPIAGTHRPASAGAGNPDLVRWTRVDHTIIIPVGGEGGGAAQGESASNTPPEPPPPPPPPAPPMMLPPPPGFLFVPRGPNPYNTSAPRAQLHLPDTSHRKPAVASRSDPLQRNIASLLEMPEPFSDVVITFPDADPSEPPMMANRFMVGSASLAIAMELQGVPATQVARIAVRHSRSEFESFIDFLYSGDLRVRDKKTVARTLELASALSSESLLAFCNTLLFTPGASVEPAPTRLTNFLAKLAEAPTFADATLVVKTTKRVLAAVPCHRALLSMFSWRLRPMIASLYDRARASASTPTPISPIVVRKADEAPVAITPPQSPARQSAEAAAGVIVDDLIKNALSVHLARSSAKTNSEEPAPAPEPQNAASSDAPTAPTIAPESSSATATTTSEAPAASSSASTTTEAPPATAAAATSSTAAPEQPPATTSEPTAAPEAAGTSSEATEMTVPKRYRTEPPPPPPPKPALTLEQIAAIKLPPPCKITFVVPEDETAPFKYTNEVLVNFLKYMYTGRNLPMALAKYNDADKVRELRRLINLSLVLQDDALKDDCSHFSLGLSVSAVNAHELWQLAVEPRLQNSALAERCVKAVIDNVSVVRERGMARKWPPAFTARIVTALLDKQPWKTVAPVPGKEGKERFVVNRFREDNLRSMITLLLLAVPVRRMEGTGKQLFERIVETLHGLLDSGSTIRKEFGDYFTRGALMLRDAVWESGSEEGLTRLLLEFTLREFRILQFKTDAKRAPPTFARTVFEFLRQLQTVNPKACPTCERTRTKLTITITCKVCQRKACCYYKVAVPEEFIRQGFPAPPPPQPTSPLKLCEPCKALISFFFNCSIV